MNTSLYEDFFNPLQDIKNNKVDVSKVLKAFYAKEKLSNFGADGEEEVLPIFICSTHVTTIQDGVIKAISFSDFINILNKLESEKDKIITPMGLPYGCFMFSRSGSFMHLNCYYRGVTADIKFQNNAAIEIHKIPLPNIILSFILEKVNEKLWRVSSVRYFSTNKTVSQLPDDIFINSTNTALGIYKLPFSNMYGDNRMCFGSNTMPARMSNNLRGLDYYYQILTEAPFNSDLGINGLKSSYTPKNWYKHLSTLSEFPYDMLINQSE